MWGRPVLVSSDANQEELERKRRELEGELNRITAEADAAVLT